MRRVLLALVLLSCGSRSLTFPMIAQNNSGQNGSAVLTETSGGLDVRIEIKRSTFPGRQNSHIHKGRCDDVGDIDFAIAPFITNKEDGGESTTDGGATVVFHTVLADRTLVDVNDGNHVINVHDARDNSLYVSCGEIR